MSQPELHVCWFVDPWSEERQCVLDAWREAGWEVVLWHWGQLGAEPRAELRDAHELVVGSIIGDAFEFELGYRSHASCADLFRYHVLAELGGAYADADVLPKNAPPSLLERALPLFEYDIPARKFEIRFLVSPGRHEVFSKLRSTAVDATASFMATGGYRSKYDFLCVMDRTGPHMALRVVRGWARENGIEMDELIASDAIHADTKLNHGHHYVARWSEVEDEARRRSPRGKLGGSLEPTRWRERTTPRRRRSAS